MRATLLETPPLDAYAQMALDEAVLEHSDPGELVLRIYRWAGRTADSVTFGYSQRYEDVEALVRRRGTAPGAPIVRRCTGGGVVYHDGDITFSFVFPWPRLTAPRTVYRRVHRGAHAGLREAGIPSRVWHGAPGAAPQCFAGPEPEDLVHDDGTKFLGGALRRRKARGLYQGSLRPEGFNGASGKLVPALVEGFAMEWAALFERRAPAAEVSAEAVRLRKERYTLDRWNKRR